MYKKLLCSVLLSERAKCLSPIMYHAFVKEMNASQKKQTLFKNI